MWSNQHRKHCIECALQLRYPARVKQWRRVKFLQEQKRYRGIAKVSRVVAASMAGAQRYPDNNMDAACTTAHFNTSASKKNMSSIHSRPMAKEHQIGTNNLLKASMCLHVHSPKSGISLTRWLSSRRHSFEIERMIVSVTITELQKVHQGRPQARVSIKAKRTP